MPDGAQHRQPAVRAFSLSIYIHHRVVFYTNLALLAWILAGGVVLALVLTAPYNHTNKRTHSMDSNRFCTSASNFAGQVIDYTYV